MVTWFCKYKANIVLLFKRLYLGNGIIKPGKIYDYTCSCSFLLWYYITPDSTTQSVNDANLNSGRDERICNYSFHFKCDLKEKKKGRNERIRNYHILYLKNMKNERDNFIYSDYN